MIAYTRLTDLVQSYYLAYRATTTILVRFKQIILHSCNCNLQMHKN